MVLEDGAIHHPTRLSVGPAWLTAAIYLNVIGSKLVKGRVVKKEGPRGKGGLLGNFPEARPQPQIWVGGGWQRHSWRKCGVLSMVLNPTDPFFFTGDNGGGRGGRAMNSVLPWESDGRLEQLQW